MGFSNLADYSWMGYVIVWTTIPLMIFVCGGIGYKLFKIKFTKSSRGKDRQ